jgi:hypothetical protein
LTLFLKITATKLPQKNRMQAETIVFIGRGERI